MPARQRIRFTRPTLPDWMDECRITGLRLGDATVDLQLIRHGGDVALHVLGAPARWRSRHQLKPASTFDSPNSWKVNRFMSLPRYASRGPGRFLLHYVGPSFRQPPDRAGRGAGRRRLRHRRAIRREEPGRRAGRSGVGDTRCGARSAFCWRSSPATICCGGWPAGSRPYAFVAVGGDLRLDLFDHLSGHGTRYFADQFPGALAGRISTAANTAWTIENSLTWTTIPPGAAVISSIALLGTINWQITAVLFAVVAILGTIIAKLAMGGHDLHARFAGRAAAVSGDITDVVSNMSLVRAFGAAKREQDRCQRKIEREMSAQRESLQSLERLRLFHAFSVFVVTAGVLVWAVELWRLRLISTGDVVLTTSLGFTVLHASATSPWRWSSWFSISPSWARRSRSWACRMKCRTAPTPSRSSTSAAASRSKASRSTIRAARRCYGASIFMCRPARRSGWSAIGRRQVDDPGLLQRHYDATEGRVLIDEQDIST
jgi:hypothetical protein